MLSAAQQLALLSACRLSGSFQGQRFRVKGIEGHGALNAVSAAWQVRKTMTACSYVDVVSFMAVAGKQEGQDGAETAGLQVISRRRCQCSPCLSTACRHRPMQLEARAALPRWAAPAATPSEGALWAHARSCGTSTRRRLPSCSGARA